MKENCILHREALNLELIKAQLSSKLENSYNKLDKLFQENRISKKRMDEYSELIQQLLKINSGKEVPSQDIENINPNDVVNIPFAIKNITLEAAKKDLKTAIKILDEGIENLTEEPKKSIQSEKQANKEIEEKSQIQHRKNDPKFFAKIIPPSENPFAQSSNVDTPIL